MDLESGNTMTESHDFCNSFLEQPKLKTYQYSISGWSAGRYYSKAGNVSTRHFLETYGEVSKICQQEFPLPRFDPDKLTFIISEGQQVLLIQVDGIDRTADCLSPAEMEERDRILESDALQFDYDEDEEEEEQYTYSISGWFAGRHYSKDGTVVAPNWVMACLEIQEIIERDFPLVRFPRNALTLIVGCKSLEAARGGINRTGEFVPPDQLAFNRQQIDVAELADAVNAFRGLRAMCASGLEKGAR